MSKKQAIEVANAVWSVTGDKNVAKVWEQIKDLPSVRKMGKWIKNDNGTWSCSKCSSWIPDEQHYYANYCLYCGADMRGEKI